MEINSTAAAPVPPLKPSFLQWPRTKVKQLYRWTVHWSDTPQAVRALAFLSFIESSFFPIPPDPLLMAMTAAKPKKYFYFATVCTAASVLGGVVGYFIGVTLFETVGQWVIDVYHLQEAFLVVAQKYEANAFLAIFTAAFTPIPYKLFTIAAGVFRVNIGTLVIASIIGRGTRFYVIAFLMSRLGERFKDKIEKYIDILSLAFVALLIFGFVAVKVWYK